MFNFKIHQPKNGNIMKVIKHFQFMNPLTTNIGPKTIHNQSIQQQDIKQLISWINAQISNKNLPQINSIQDLSSGNIFLEIVSVYHPKKIDFTKIFVKPKDDYEILQNYKQLLFAFTKLGWKKFNPQTLRKKKDKDLINMTLFLKKILSDHLFDHNESTLHTILNELQSPQNSQLSKTLKEPIKTEDRKSIKVINRSSSKKQRQSLRNGVKKQEFNIKIPDKKHSISSIHPRKPVNDGIKSSTLQDFRPKDTKSSMKLPPHPYNSSKNISPDLETKPSQEEQLNSFESMRITKLQKEKSSLLKKILQIQQIITRQKQVIFKGKEENKFLEEESFQRSKQITIEQRQNIDRIKKMILDTIGEI